MTLQSDRDEQIQVPWDAGSNPLPKIAPPTQLDFGADVYYIVRFWILAAIALASAVLFFMSYVFLGNRGRPLYNFLWCAPDDTFSLLRVLSRFSWWAIISFGIVPISRTLLAAFDCSGSALAAADSVPCWGAEHIAMAVVAGSLLSVSGSHHRHRSGGISSCGTASGRGWRIIGSHRCLFLGDLAIRRARSW